jgi:hypothetical protein
MSKFTFTNPLNGQIIEVEGPPTLTQAQAQEIFKQQFDAGSLVGLRSGDTINSASQLAGGLLSSAAQVSQSLLPQASTLLNQGLPQALTTASAAATDITDKIKNVVPTLPINMGDLAKQTSSLMPMQGLDQLDVRSTLSQASKLVSQAADQVSNELGAGKFGFDAQQLERAGVLKPGTFSTYLADGTANLTSVLNSPSVWTGANGITDVDKLLSSVPTQNLIQQDLMSQGLSGVKELGVNIDKLGKSLQAGVALNASKSIQDTVAWAKGLPLPAEVKTQLDQAARDAAFATDLGNTVANDAVKQQDPALPAIDTAQRQTVDAATTRVTGSDKIPQVDFQSASVQELLGTTVATFGIQVDVLARNRYTDLNNQTIELIPLTDTVSTEKNPAQIASLLQRWQDLLGEYDAFSGEILSLQRQSQALETRSGKPIPGAANLEAVAVRIPPAVAIVKKYIDRLQNLLQGLTS